MNKVSKSLTVSLFNSSERINVLKLTISPLNLDTKD